VRARLVASKLLVPSSRIGEIRWFHRQCHYHVFHSAPRARPNTMKSQCFAIMCGELKCSSRDDPFCQSPINVSLLHESLRNRMLTRVSIASPLLRERSGYAAPAGPSKPGCDPDKVNVVPVALSVCCAPCRTTSALPIVVRRDSLPGLREKFTNTAASASATAHFRLKSIETRPLPEAVTLLISRFKLPVRNKAPMPE